MNQILQKKLTSLTPYLEKYGVAKLYAFGSVLTNNFNSNSDIDFLVEFSQQDIDPIEKGERLMNLQNELENLFKRPIDLKKLRPFRNPYFQKEVDRTKRLIYERSTQKIFG